MTTPTQPDPMAAMAGSNDLQSSLDRLDGDVKGLTRAIQGQNNGNGTSTSPAVAGSFASQGVTFTGGSYAGAGGGSGGSGSLAGGIFNGGSGGTFGTNPFSFSGGSGAQALANIGTSIINGQFLAGAQQLNDQAQINTYGYQQAGFWNASSRSVIRTTFGGDSGRNLFSNNLAYSAADARMGGTLLAQISGQANYTAGAGPVYGRGNAPYQLAAATGLANPGLGMTGSASVAGALYNPSTSYNLMMMGISQTPLQLGTGRANNISGVEAAIGQRFGFQGFNSKTGTFDSQNLAANLNNPLFEMQMMQATGMTQQQYNQWAQQWAQTNTWALNGKTTMNQMQNEISQYMNGSAGQQKQAQSWLTSHGVQMSLLQSMQQAQAGQTGAEAGGNAAFTKGLQAATSVVERFTAALSAGLQKMAGTSGFAAAIGSLNQSGVSGAGAGGVTNTVLNAIAGDIGNLGKDINTFSASLSSYQNAGGPSGGSSGGGGGNVSVGGGTSKGSSSMPGWAKNMMQQFGWGDSSSLDAMNNIEMHEAGWNSTIFNGAGSGAFGIAQALGHGNGAATQGTMANQYGGFGLSDSLAKAANSGNAQAQFLWMMKYIKSKYRNPQNAWAGYFGADLGGPVGYADGTTSAKPGVTIVGERGPEAMVLSGGQQIISASQTAKMMQPMFSGGGMGAGGGGLTIIFQSGALTLHSNGGGGMNGYHTSGDVQSTAAQYVQAIETAIQKSAILKNLSMGITG